MLDKDKIDTRVKETSLGGLMLTGYSGALYKTDVVSMETRGSHRFRMTVKFYEIIQLVCPKLHVHSFTN